jgi:neutral ceramidase
MVQLKFVRSSDNQPIGAINWFAVHANSMNSTNCLVSSDNMGYASILLEAHLNNGSLPGTVTVEIFPRDKLSTSF